MGLLQLFGSLFSAAPQNTSVPRGRSPSRTDPSRDDRYRLSAFRTVAHHALSALPPFWREKAAEHFLRRDGAPGPAAEHVLQYLLSAEKSKRKADQPAEATVAKGADNFYERQYRQYLNDLMGAFAMTATRALLGSGSAPKGLLWRYRRRACAAMLEAERIGAPPLFVINSQTVAVPLLIPKPGRQEDGTAVVRWLTGNGPMPGFYSYLVAGKAAPCSERHIQGRMRSAVGSLLELIDAAINSKKLAILALHPHDPDAMGLHITLFGTRCLMPRLLEEDYGLEPAALAPWRDAASTRDMLLVFCVGGTEEVFTQCSQNLFVKRPAADGMHTTAARRAWIPAMPLEHLLGAQFETLQVTVSASGLPGVSPRNGDIGKAAFVARRNSKTFVLIPYYPGNAVHGHAAKLWSNNRGALVIWDDAFALTGVTISGPCKIATHEVVERDFPAVAVKAVARQKHTGSLPEYWFVQEAGELVQQTEQLIPNMLDPIRPTCSINAGGEARHGKKPAYFAAGSLPLYDQALQHEREAAGTPIDPHGQERWLWNESVRDALEARQAHLSALYSLPVDS